MKINQIYNEILTEHVKSGHNKRHLENPSKVCKGVNPSCGDEISLELKEENQTIIDASFTGSGCAISMASTSIMIDLIKGKTIEEASKLKDIFFGMIRSEITNEEELEALEDAIALKDISFMPARVKCAVLAWRTLEEIYGDHHHDKV